MKKGYKNIKIIFTKSLILFTLFSLKAQPGSTYISQSPGGIWSDNSTWNLNSPGNTLGDNMIIQANHSVQTIENYDITLNNNNKSIDIYGELIINGTLNVVGNRWELNIHDNGVLIINGDVNFSSSGQGGGTVPNLIIEGTAAIYGSLTGNGQVSGNGSLYIQDDYPDWLDGTQNVNLLPVDPFPIELLSFNAEMERDHVKVTWVTASEINNDYFTLERSSDGHTWEILTFIEGAGNSNQKLSYGFKDFNPLNGISYYRLKQTDFDGAYEYFTPVAVNNNGFLNTEVEIMKITAHNGTIQIWLTNNNAPAELIVSDIQGRIISRTLTQPSQYAQQLSLNYSGNHSGEVLLVSLQSSLNNDTHKILIR